MNAAVPIRMQCRHNPIDLRIDSRATDTRFADRIDSGHTRGTDLRTATDQRLVVHAEARDATA